MLKTDPHLWKSTCRLQLREKERKENQEALLKAVASSKWSYEKIMEFIQSDPEEADE